MSSEQKNLDGKKFLNYSSLVAYQFWRNEINQKGAVGRYDFEVLSARNILLVDKIAEMNNLRDQLDNLLGHDYCTRFYLGNQPPFASIIFGSERDPFDINFTLHIEGKTKDSLDNIKLIANPRVSLGIYSESEPIPLETGEPKSIKKIVEEEIVVEPKRRDINEVYTELRAKGWKI